MTRIHIDCQSICQLKVKSCQVCLSWQSFNWTTAPTEGELVGVEVVGDILGKEV